MTVRHSVSAFDRIADTAETFFFLKSGHSCRLRYLDPKLTTSGDSLAIRRHWGTVTRAQPNCMVGTDRSSMKPIRFFTIDKGCQMLTAIRSIDMQIIDRIFGMEGGYVLDFSDRSMAQFFAHDLNIDIDHPRYRDDGPSKARRLRCFLRKEDAETVVRVLNALWEFRETRRALAGQEEQVPKAHAQLLNLTNRLQGKASPSVASRLPPPAFEKLNYVGLIGELMALQSIDPHRRGYVFEDFLKRVFSAFGLLPRGGFRTIGEQIDGSFILAGDTYLLEAKWHNALTPAADLYTFQGKLNARVTWARGLFVSYSGFTVDGIAAYGRGTCSVVCMDGLDLNHPLISLWANKPLNSVAVETAFANPAMSGASLCSGMLGMSS